VDKLSKEKQDIIKMRFWEELKFSEIAEKLGKSEDAIKKMFYRTIEEIKKLLD
jgi:RNA polymerase sigma factor (sigma-70 family)